MTPLRRLLTITVVLALVSLSKGRPYRSKRQIVKDFFNPIVLSAPEFEKKEEGKYYERGASQKKPYHDSEVTYVESFEPNLDKGDKAINEKKDVLKKGVNDYPKKYDDTLKKLEGEIVREIKKEINIEKSESTKGEKIPEKKIDIPPVSEMAIPFKPEIMVGQAEAKIAEDKIEIPFIHDTIVPLKPVDDVEKKDIDQGKFYVPLNPEAAAEKGEKESEVPENVGEGEEPRLTMVRVPQLYPGYGPQAVGYGVPILVPIQRLTYGAMSFAPIPTMDVSDRLPMPDVLEESSEEESAEEEPEVNEEARRQVAYQLGNQLALGMRFPYWSLRNMLKEVESVVSKMNDTIPDEDDSKSLGEMKSEVVNIEGKKFLLKTNIIRHPNSDNSRMFIRQVSVTPIEDEIDPTLIKEKDLANKEKKQEERKNMIVKKQAEDEMLLKKRDDSPKVMAPDEILLQKGEVSVIVEGDEMMVKNEENEKSEVIGDEMLVRKIEEENLEKSGDAEMILKKIDESKELVAEETQLKKVEFEESEDKKIITEKVEEEKSKEKDEEEEEEEDDDDDDEEKMETTDGKKVEKEKAMKDKEDAKQKDLVVAEAKESLLVAERKKKMTFDVEKREDTKSKNKKGQKKCKCETTEDSESESDDN